jgi:hypothetical protein
MTKCIDLLKKYGDADKGCCISVKKTSECCLLVTQKSCIDRPRLTFTVETIVGRDYVVQSDGTQEGAGVGVCFFVESRNCSDDTENEILVTRQETDPTFQRYFRFTATTETSLVGLRFIEGQAEQSITFCHFRVCEVPALKTCGTDKKVYLIRQENIGCGGLMIIDRPGHYRLIEDVECRAHFAIQIESSHVDLDLDGHTVSVKFCNSDLSIINDTTGIKIIPLSTCATIINKKCCKSTSVVTTPEPLTALAVYNGYVVEAKGATRGPGVGIRIIDVDDSLFDDLRVEKSEGRGFIIAGGQRLELSKCVAKLCGTGGYALSVNPLQTRDSVENRFTRCRAIDNLGNGFLFNDGGSNVLIDCESIRNKSNGYTLSQSDSNRFSQCVAIANGTINGPVGSGNGFVLAGQNLSNKNILDQCIARDNIFNGFQIIGANNTVKNCQADGNGTNGFINPLLSTNIYVSNLSYNNTTNYANVVPVALIGSASSYWINVANILP